MPEETILQSAKRKADLLYLSGQAQQLWHATQRDLLWTVDDARSRQASGASAEVVAAKIREQGEALIASFARGEPLMAEIKDALAMHGMTAEEVQAGYDAVLAGCQAMRDTPVDGSGVEALLAYMDASFTAPVRIW